MYHGQYSYGAGLTTQTVPSWVPHAMTTHVPSAHMSKIWDLNEFAHVEDMVKGSVHAGIRLSGACCCACHANSNVAVVQRYALRLQIA